MDDLNTAPAGSLEHETDYTSEKELNMDDDVVDDDEVDVLNIYVKKLAVRITVSLGLISIFCFVL